MNYNFNCTGIKNVIWVVRLVRTHELQQNHGQLFPGYGVRVRLVRTYELQHVVCEPYHSTVGCASYAPTNYNNQIIKDSNLDYGCAPYAPTNYNGDNVTSVTGFNGAPRAHQRITTTA